MDYGCLQRSVPGKVIANNIKVQVINFNEEKHTVTLFDGESDKPGTVQSATGAHRFTAAKAN